MKITTWLSSSLQRQYPRLAPPRQSPGRALALLAARGERVSFQVCLRLEDAETADVSVSAEAPAGLEVQIRRVGLVPMPHWNTDTPMDEADGVGHVPGLVPDPLFPENKTRLARQETASFWITVAVPRTARPGAVKIPIEVHYPENGRAKLAATLHISQVVMAKRRNFSVTHWFYADALCDWYKVQPFEEAFWAICEKYMRNYAGHGLDTIYLPVFTPPLDGVKRPTQLLGVKPTGKDRYAFDWSLVERWVKLAKRCGIPQFEWTHLFTQWGVKHAIRIYQKKNGQDTLLWPAETGATSSTYRAFLSQFLPQLENFIKAHKLGRSSFFHVSDEPHGEEHLANYRSARDLLAELAPWMKVMDALSDIRYGREKLTDIPVPSIITAKQFHDEGIPSWCYFCCGPRGRYLNRLFDTPLPKTRMAGWLFYRFGAQGFLHWGYNYWYKSQTQQMIDPYHVADGLAWPGWAYGDTSVVYPGPAEIGPIDSIRWEIFAESLQDYTLLQTLGVDPNGKMLASLKNFNDFPKDERWLQSARKRLLS